MELEIKPCPFCGQKLNHIYGKRINRFYKGESTGYSHYNPNCILHGITVTEHTLDKWNRRVGNED